MRAGLILLSLSLIAGCATRVPLEPVPSLGPATVRTQSTANVVLAIGVAYGLNNTPHLHFNAEDQRIFVDSLRKDLERLGIFGNARDASLDKPSDYGILVNFLRTFHATGHEYMLVVDLELRGGAAPLVKRYGLLSYQGEPWYRRWITNASEGKTLAARKLSALLISDISEYVWRNEVSQK